MRILFVSAEVAPYAKVGGLADVAGSLPKALQDLGHDVRVVMPAYGLVTENPEFGVKPVEREFFVRVNDSRFERATIQETNATGFPIWLLDTEGIFHRAKTSEEVYTFQRNDYLFFAQAALEVCQDMSWMPDVVHCHDWHTGFIPVVMRESRGEIWDEVASVFTIHNLAYQGEFGFDTLDAIGVRHDLYHPDYTEAYGSVNFLKSGMAFADQVNTVSPNYVKEIQTPQFGCRLEGLMIHLAENDRLSGILNGIDMEVFNPATDPHVVAAYSADDVSGKTQCRAALIEEAGLNIPAEDPIFAMVTRLSNQKGFDLVLHAADRMIAAGGALVVQGLGDPWAAGQLRTLEQRHPGRVKFFQVFDADLAQRVYSGADAFLMPSAFEPCGLGQMFAMRYGTVPVVKKTGGLADTVFDGKNGFVFGDHTSDALSSTVERAISAFRKPKIWAKIQHSGMTGDYSWTKSAKAYSELYKKAAAMRKQLAGSR